MTAADPNPALAEVTTTIARATANAPATSHQYL
jgi:hypothetical protein